MNNEQLSYLKTKREQLEILLRAPSQADPWSEVSDWIAKVTPFFRTNMTELFPDFASVTTEPLWVSIVNPARPEISQELHQAKRATTDKRIRAILSFLDGIFELPEVSTTTTRIEGTFGDNAQNVVLGQNNRLTYNHNTYIGTPEPINIDDLSIEEKELLQAGYTNELIVYPRLGSSIPIIRAGQKTFPEDAKYPRALKKLRNCELIILTTQKRETYELTEKGDKIAETLLNLR